ncbi:uncharacterized protein LOC5502828 [Nematostella vectensis]|uniref:uncharacterized protein LOC5502828 n=1 Tax=Nematostella vectensis TaxID=45351 RepID=UPI002076E484|nr:uncharacterized protein LOC5502828 [Nematostella vectensis]
MGLTATRCSSLNAFQWSFILVILWRPQIADTKIINSTEGSTNFCNFPEYLRCVGDSITVCKWSSGERFPLRPWEERDPSNVLAFLGRSQFEWTVEKSSIIIDQFGFNSESDTVVKLSQRTLRCLNETKNKNNQFIISIEETYPGQSLLYSCIQCVQRGENVVSYGLGNGTKNFGDDLCSQNYLTMTLLISDRFNALADCPSELQGAFDVTRVYDGSRDCKYNGAYGLLESNCLSQEGIYIDLQGDNNCTNSPLPFQHPYELHLRCLSKPWEDNNFKYIIAAQRPRWRFEFRGTGIKCLKYTKIKAGEFKLDLFNDLTCEMSRNDKHREPYTLHLKSKTTAAPPRVSPGGKCTFPRQLRGRWIEESNQNGINTIDVQATSISIPPYGLFECKERFGDSSLPQECGHIGLEDRWPGSGRVRFYFDDYMVVSRFDNGCRDRISRLGFTNTVNDRVLVYRLSQSEPMVRNGRTYNEYYQMEVLKRFCSQFYIYLQDDYPKWGRNIEKIIIKPQLPSLPIKDCDILNSGNHLTWRTADTSSCRSWIQAGCGLDKTQTLFKVQYADICGKKDVEYRCLGKAYKFGHFVLLRNSVTLRVNCAWHDKETNAILLLDSPQCSDVDWGRRRGQKERYSERFTLKYYEKCPLVSKHPKVVTGSQNRRSAEDTLHVPVVLIIAILLLGVELVSF